MWSNGRNNGIFWPADNSSAEYEIGIRQLALKRSSKQSWFLHIDEILEKYSLPRAHVVILDVPRKSTWSDTVKKAITQYWENLQWAQASQQRSLRYISRSSMQPGSPSSLWTTAVGSHPDTVKAFIKVKLLTGTYRLQVHEPQFRRNQHDVSPICKLCSLAVEDRVHFLLECPKLMQYRSHYIEQFRGILDGHNLVYLLHNQELQLQLILDSTHNKLPDIISKEQLTDVLERISRNLIYKLHGERWKLLESLA